MEPENRLIKTIDDFSFKENDLKQLNIPDVLYKYREWDNSFHKRVLTDFEVFYANSLDFEDPNDSKNLPRYDLLSKKDKIKFGEHVVKNQNPDYTRQQVRAEVRKTYQNSPLRNPTTLKEYMRDDLKRWQERSGILSLTANPLNKSMWDKYSANGQGYCVGFNTKKFIDCVRGGGGPVQYVEELPKVWPRPFHDFDQQHILRIFFKELKWSFEEEYRLHTFSKDPLSSGDRVKKVHAAAFYEVLLGYNMPSDKKKELLQSLPMELSSIPVFETEIQNGEVIKGNKVNPS